MLISFRLFWKLWVRGGEGGMGRGKGEGMGRGKGSGGEERQ